MQRESRRELLKRIAHLSWPTMVEQALQTVVQFADSAMVGRLGALASASVGMTASVTWLVNSPMHAMGVGVLAVIARSMGAGNRETAKRAGVQSMYLTLLMGVLVGAITLAVSPHLPRWLGAEEELHRPTSTYFAIVCLPMLFRASLVMFGYVLRAARDMRTPMIVNVLVNVINIVLNFFLIFETRTVHLLGLAFTMPGAGLGVTGAAIATSASYVVGGTLMFLALLRNPDVSPRAMALRPDKAILAACARVGAPVALSRVASCLGHVVFASQVTRLGTTALAAHTLALTAEEAFYIPGYGMQAAASTLCGNALGERNERKLVDTAWTITGLCALLMAFSGAVLFLIPETMMRLFTPDEAVIALGVGVLRIVALSEPFFGAGVILEGVFNGIGDTRTPLVFSIATMWGVRILGTYICVEVFSLGLMAVWGCMVACNLAYFALMAARFVRGSWKQVVEI